MRTEKSLPVQAGVKRSDALAIVEKLSALLPAGAVDVWLEDRSAFSDLELRDFPPDSKTQIERIASWPCAPLDPGLVEQLEPMPSAKVFQAVAVTIGHLSAPNSESALQLALRACTDNAIRRQASAADFALAKLWIDSALDAPGRPEEIPLIQFRPAPALFDTILARAQDRNRSAIAGYTRRATMARRCSALLQDWSGHLVAREERLRERRARFELERKERETQLAEARKAMADHEARELERRRAEDARDRERRHKMLEELKAHRQALPEEQRNALDILGRRTGQIVIRRRRTDPE